MRSPLRTLAATMLVLEAFVLLFAALVARNLSDLAPAVALGGGVGLAVACVLTAGLLRWRIGYVVGWVLQLAMILTGLVIPMMFGIGLLFTGLWVSALVVGTKIERERAYVASALESQQGGPATDGGRPEAGTEGPGAAPPAG
jgi:hypothetical protein